jgi:hypothetical protein
MSAPRSSALTRAVRYFKEASIEEAEAAYGIVQRVMAGRLGPMVAETVAPKPRRTRKAKASAVPAPAQRGLEPADHATAQTAS